MKINKLIRKALKTPELYSESELLYFKMVKKHRKQLKKARKAALDQQSESLQ